MRQLRARELDGDLALPLERLQFWPKRVDDAKLGIATAAGVWAAATSARLLEKL
jgi:hypothetical protein